ncbi:MAG: hypothetical protein DHS20C17_14230 [Cyclobacteriaceae bacterium]|nr:MAG: hypothetical protein DHS20C17_14230 [Cyclobacteriaceae bacterium]
MTFNLKFSEVLQGSFKPAELNLMMVFQVNCPGCFLQGFPQIISLQTRYQNKLSCFALSTAFEDFELNTAENTRLLLEENILVGETKKAFESRGLKWEVQIPFPVLIDTMINQQEMLRPDYIETVISNHPQFLGVSKPELAEAKKSLQSYFTHYQQCGYTFATNLLRGTPSFILFNQRMEILFQWFGHMDSNSIETKLDEYFVLNSGDKQE